MPTKRAYGIAAVGVMLATELVDVPTVEAAYPACNLVPNSYGQQNANHGYKGLYGRLESAHPYVPNYTQGFSLSHLYMATSNAHRNWFVEVGWYKGSGTEIDAYPYSRYYTAKADSVTPYTEHDFGEIGSQGVMRQYEVQYEDHTPNYEQFIWRVYANGLGTPLYTWAHKDMGAGLPIAGAEIGSASANNSAAFSHIDSMQLRLNSSSWSYWTPTFMSQQGDSMTVCDDGHIDFAFVSNYTEHRVTGTKN